MQIAELTGTAQKVLEALQNHIVADNGDGSYRLNSPFREGSDGQSCVLTIEDSEHGVYYDHNGNTNATLYQLADELGIERPKGISSTKRAYEGLEDYAKAHHVPVEVFKHLGWQEGYYPHGKIGEDKGRPAISFNTLNGVRWRFIDGENPTYKSQTGFKSSWYGFPYAIKTALENNQPLVICNGEASTITAQYYGVAAVALAGGTEKGSLPDHLLEELKQAYPVGKPILVALDKDDTGVKAAPALAELLNNAGYAAKAVDLGFKHGSKGDLSDFCGLHLQDSPDKVNSLPMLNTGKVKLWSFAELATLPPISWLIPNEIPAEAFGVLYGPSGSGKSFMALDYALTIAQTGIVIYVAAEGKHGYADRIAAWINHHKKSANGLLLVGDAINMLEKDTVDTFISTIRQLAPKMVIIDTLARCMVGGDENSAKDVGEFIAACDKVKQATKATVLVVHHTGKNQEAKERGSSALRGASDVMIELTNSEGTITLTCSKMKDAEEFNKRFLRTVQRPARPGQTSLILLPANQVEAEIRLTANDQAVLNTLLSAMYGNSGARNRQIRDHSGVSEGSVPRTLEKLLNCGYIAKSSAKQPIYTITESGKTAYDQSQPFTPLGSNRASTTKPAPIRIFDAKPKGDPVVCVYCQGPLTASERKQPRHIAMCASCKAKQDVADQEFIV